MTLSSGGVAARIWTLAESSEPGRSGYTLRGLEIKIPGHTQVWAPSFFCPVVQEPKGKHEHKNRYRLLKSFKALDSGKCRVILRAHLHRPQHMGFRAETVCTEDVTSEQYNRRKQICLWGGAGTSGIITNRTIQASRF